MIRISKLHGCSFDDLKNKLLPRMFSSPHPSIQFEEPHSRESSLLSLSEIPGSKYHLNREFTFTNEEFEYQEYGLSNMLLVEKYLVDDVSGHQQKEHELKNCIKKHILRLDRMKLLETAKKANINVQHDLFHPSFIQKDFVSKTASALTSMLMHKSEFELTTLRRKSMRILQQENKHHTD